MLYNAINCGDLFYLSLLIRWKPIKSAGGLRLSLDDVVLCKRTLWHQTSYIDKHVMTFKRIQLSD